MLCCWLHCWLQLCLTAGKLDEASRVLSVKIPGDEQLELDTVSQEAGFKQVQPLRSHSGDLGVGIVLESPVFVELDGFQRRDCEQSAIDSNARYLLVSVH